MPRLHALDLPVCPRCGERVGVYEPAWRIAPHIGAECTSWLRVRAQLGSTDVLWHVACAESEGVDGG